MKMKVLIATDHTICGSIIVFQCGMWYINAGSWSPTAIVSSQNQTRADRRSGCGKQLDSWRCLQWAMVMIKGLVRLNVIYLSYRLYHSICLIWMLTFRPLWGDFHRHFAILPLFSWRISTRVKADCWSWIWINTLWIPVGKCEAWTTRYPDPLGCLTLKAL